MSFCSRRNLNGAIRLAYVVSGFAVIGIVAILLFFSFWAKSPDLFNNGYSVGAIYYTWYPKNFKQGYLRARIKPAQTPVLGIYDSMDTSVAERHIAWASRYGIDFFSIGWWPWRDEQNRVIKDTFLKAKNIDDIKFSIFYETWSLNFDRKTGSTIFDDKSEEKMIADFVKIADLFFDHPSYLKIDGRPVVYLYLTRTLYGSYKQAFLKLRRELKTRGHDIFLIADEVFWGVVPSEGFGKPVPNPEKVHNNPYLTPEPQYERIKIFDAITSYNMYESGSKGFKGYGSKSSFFHEVGAKYKEYIKVANGMAAFVPGIIPGYNDRGVRSGENHFAIPRRYAPDLPEGSFFAEAFNQLAFPFMDPRLNMVMITSWNEWNEDTSIEPLANAEATSSDVSDDKFFTEGYLYEGYGTKYLEVIRDKVVAVAGRVTDVAGDGVADVAVCGWKKNKKVTCDKTDHAGYYTLSRLHIKTGVAEVGIDGRESRLTVTVDKEKSATGVDFKI
ncbi:hypothetical protein MNBD_NITROSPINAE01-1751 [hydrothermal vent metagenome]|uniref:Uncharacterized protein n=1 Tax=hydrothermal vent metagenome TaxID=652676 RepID=A0A3B1BL97_9ZZZZ